VIVTRNRAVVLRRCLAELAALPERPRVVVVDDASTDRTADVVREFPHVVLVSRERWEGPVARNHGVERACTPYVAFTDDDSWWAAGALDRAAELLERNPRLAVVTARILVGDERRTDAICEEMASSPVRGDPSVAGIPVLSFMGGASVMRRSAFRAVGGFEPRLIGGGEEESTACDLAVAGWELRYVPEVVAHHHPVGGDKRVDRMLGIRNALWFAWRRRPLLGALRWTAYMLRATPVSRLSLLAFWEALRGLPWALRTRRVVPPRVEAGLRALDHEKMTSRARRYG
jgi:N-acetylglucosaminyl-diphospho-decaprenol L-rhamnosyltransferase